MTCVQEQVPKPERFSNDGRSIVIVAHKEICAGLIGHACGTFFHDRVERHTLPKGGTSDILIGIDGECLSRATREIVDAVISASATFVRTF